MLSGSVKTLINQQFNSFEEFASLAVAWNADFRQMDSESFKSNMFQAQIGSILVSSAGLGCHVEQRGEIPPGMRTFAIPEAGSAGLHWYGQNLEADVLLYFPWHGEIDVFSRPGFSVLTVSIPELILEKAIEQLGVPRIGEAIGSAKTTFVAPRAALKSLRVLLRQAPEIASLGDESHFSICEYQEQVFSALFQVIGSGKPGPGFNSGLNQDRFENILEYIEENAHLPLRVADLCSVSGISERSLQYLFKKEFGMTPKSYLTGKRLYGAHRELWRSQAGNTSVSDIANHWGFWHLGQFAADYQKVFGMLPSATLKQIS